MNWNVEPLSILAEQLNTLLRKTVELAPNIVAAVVLLLITWLIARLLGGAIRKVLVTSQSRPSLVVALAKLARIIVWVIGILLTATVVFPGLTPTRLLAGLGIGSIAVGLAFKDIFENFLAGFLILLRKPMRIGDDIECEDLSGRVEQISIRDTFLRKRSGELVLVPNSYIYKNPVRILTDHPHRRISIIVGVAYGENVDAARDVISKALENIDTRNPEKPVEVFAHEFNSSSIDFMVRWWTGSTPLQEHQSRDQAVAAIKAALDEAGIEIPFPYRTLTFAQPLTINTESGGEQ